MITTDPADWLAVSDVKAHLNKTGSGDDAELAGFVAAAQSMIVERIGQVSAVTAVEVLDGGSDVLVLAHPPIQEVTSVVALPSGDVVPAADEEAGTDGWTLVNREGVLAHTTVFPARMRVTYTAGREPLPGNIRMAGLELVAHLWRASQHNNGGRRPQFGEADASVVPGTAYALPIRVRELLGLGRDEYRDVWVG